MKNILVTGSNGFVGSYFIDNYNKKYNINTFSFLNDNFNELCLSNIYTIIHLSALVHQMDGASAGEYEKINLTQTMDLAKKSKNSGVKYFIFMSTIAVYGKEVGTITESSTCRPITEYGKSKLKAEEELQKLEDDSFKVSIIRPPIVNGYNGPGNMKSLISLVSKVSILPFGSIKNKRSMVYVGNLCHLIDEIIIQQKQGVFLASDDKPLSTTRLIELIAQHLDRKVYLLKIPFFESLLKLVKPDFHKRLYGSLEIDNSESMKILFGEGKPSLPFSVEDGIKFMIKGES